MDMESIRQVAVLGLGTMGHGIAQTFAAAGYRVSCYDESPAARESVRERIRRNLEQMARASLVDPGTINQILGRVMVRDSESAAVADAQFVTEAISEDLAVKESLFARLEEQVAPQTILASNSSTIPVSRSAAAARCPERMIVTHWFNPPHIVPTVEVVPGPKTVEQTIRISLALMERLGKVAVRVNQELPGFLVNRVQVAMIREVWDLLDRGVASAEDIDRAIRGSLGFRLAAVGPLEVCDFGGLDIWRRVYENLVRDIRSDTRLPGTVEALTNAGHYGVKTGKGFYEYTPQSLQEKLARRDRLLLSLAKLLNASRPADAPAGSQG